MMNEETKLELLGPLRCDGVGGMALAQHEGRRVAVRWFPLGGAGPAATAALAALPAHPAVPEVVSRGADAASEWTAFDYPEGELLSKRLVLGALPKGDVLAMGAELAGALAALHEKGVCHGELSFESVLVARGGRTLLIDLLPLVANRVTDRRGETRALAALTATVDFFSPERAKGGAPSAEADVYALGALLCAAGAGRVEAAPAIERLHAIVEGVYRPAVPVALDGDLGTMLATMVAPLPEARPSAAEVERRFRELLTPDPFQALLDSKQVTANDLAPGAEPTIDDAVLRAPTRVDVQPYVPPEAFRPEAPKPLPLVVVAPELIQADPPIEARPTTPTKRPMVVAPPPTIPELRAVTPPPTAPRVPGPKRSGLASAGLLGWFAAKNARLGSVAGAAALSLLVAVTVLGEYQARAADHAAAQRKPDGAALEREARQRLEEAAPSAPSPAELRKGKGAADEF
ncbi:MAG: protein kinase [Myxococcaceae bacterium]|nr:protein kinase [Myxococcaceae bacterium]